MNTNYLGNFGENIATDFLKKRGHVIVERNIKLSYKELDIISKKNKIFIFTEVKTRVKNNYPDADSSLGSKQINNLKKAIKIYCGQNKINLSLVRLDLIAIEINKLEKKALIKRYKEIF